MNISKGIVACCSAARKLPTITKGVSIVESFTSQDPLLFLRLHSIRLSIALICNPTYTQMFRMCMIHWMGEGFFFLLSEFIAMCTGGINIAYGQ